LVSLIYSVILYPIIYIFPAYVANALPVIFGKGAKPLDFNKKIAGKRIFGDHKTINGTIAGLVGGIIVGYLESVMFGLGYLFAISVALSIGAMVGDLLGSFVKRRLDLKSGHGVPIMDQFGFYVFALIFAFPFGNMPSLYGLVFITILTGILHPLTNVIAHRLKLKKVPW